MENNKPETPKLRPCDISAIISKQRSVERFYKNQPICQYCQNPIPLNPNDRPSEAIRKKYCTRTCAGKANSLLFPNTRDRRKNPAKAFGICEDCGIEVPFNKNKKTNCYSKRRFCDACVFARKSATDCGKLVEQFTRGELVDKYGCMKAHNYIRTRARLAYSKSGLPYQCFCGYSTHTNICHLQAIKDFPLNAYLQEINDLGNLCTLCPNHHWELDHGILPHDVALNWIKKHREGL